MSMSQPIDARRLDAQEIRQRVEELQQGSEPKLEDESKVDRCARDFFRALGVLTLSSVTVAALGACSAVNTMSVFGFWGDAARHWSIPALFAAQTGGAIFAGWAGVSGPRKWAALAACATLAGCAVVALPGSVGALATGLCVNMLVSAGGALVVKALRVESVAKRMFFSQGFALVALAGVAALSWEVTLAKTSLMLWGTAASVAAALTACVAKKLQWHGVARVAVAVALLGATITAFGVLVGVSERAGLVDCCKAALGGDSSSAFHSDILSRLREIVAAGSGFQKTEWFALGGALFAGAVAIGSEEKAVIRRRQALEGTVACVGTMLTVAALTEASIISPILGVCAGVGAVAAAQLRLGVDTCLVRSDKGNIEDAAKRPRGVLKDPERSRNTERKVHFVDEGSGN